MYTQLNLLHFQLAKLEEFVSVHCEFIFVKEVPKCPLSKKFLKRSFKALEK